MTILERFLKYINVDTSSSSLSDSNPSTKGQRVLVEMLNEELISLGADTYYDEKHCYLYATLKGDENLPKIGFIAHLDTSEDASGKHIDPKIINNYDGENIQLNENNYLLLSEYPDLKNHKGKTLITTNGKTLLGADDKAGIAEIMTMLEHFSKTKISHGDICIAFTPDEEIGKGMDFFDYKRFTSPIAYTVDGSTLGEISYENFNAATAKINIEGKSCHCGTAKGIMENAILIANAIVSSLPNEIPANTEGYEGFYHLQKFNGTVSSAYLEYLIRDFDKENFENRKKLLEDLVLKLNQKYNDKITITIEDSYYNMRNIIEEDMSVVDVACAAMKEVGITPIIIPIRGGTDGAEATYNGLPCPNIGTGGHNFHGTHEYIALEDMEKTTEILIAMVKENTSRKVLTK